MLPKNLENTNKLLQKLPGIGPKTGLTLTLFLQRNARASWVQELAQELLNLKNTSKCLKCFYLTEPGKSICPVCEDKNRNHKICCVVPTEAVYINLVRSLDLKVSFFISGIVNILEGVDIQNTNIYHLITRVQNKEFDEIILTQSESQETYLILLQFLEAQVAKKNLKKISVLASGIPVGAALENTDNSTLSIAVENRIALIEESGN